MFVYNRIVKVFRRESDGDETPLYSFTPQLDRSERDIYVDVASWLLKNVSPDKMDGVDFRVEKVEVNTEVWTGE